MDKTNCDICNKLYSTNTIIRNDGYCNKCNTKTYYALVKKYNILMKDRNELMDDRNELMDDRNELDDKNYSIKKKNDELVEEITELKYDKNNLEKIINEFSIFIEGKNIKNYHDGHCDIYNSNGNISYIGDIKNGEYHGFGKKYDIFGDIEFDGYFEKGYYVKGRLYYNDGDIKYEGEFKNNSMHGEGMHFFKNSGGILKLMELPDVDYHNGELYEGRFKDGRMSGYGEYYNKDNIIIYKGEWKNNMRNGNGEIFNDTGELIYSGEILNNEINGEGKYYYNNKIIYEGNFINNKITNKEVCKICYKNEQHILFLPCGHLCMCEPCSKKYAGNNCIICCQLYTKKQKIYY